MQYMIDLETMGTSPDAPVVAIGVVAFEFDDSDTGIRYVDQLYVTCPLSADVANGAVIDADTVRWWLQQDDAASKALVSATAEVDGATPAVDVAEWFNHTEPDIGKRVVWGNGPDFDNVLLAAWLRRHNQQPMWKFYNNRCFRTALAMCRTVRRIKPTVAHHALSDATAQALTLGAVHKELPNGLG